MNASTTRTPPTSSALSGDDFDAKRPDREFARRRSSYHEAGHGLVAFLLTGTPPEVLSLRPGQAYRAVTILGPSDDTPDDVDLKLPSILRSDRRVLETRIAIDLAGELAEEMAGFRRAGYVEETDDESAAQTAARTLAALSPRHRELLAAAEAEPSMLADWDLASSSSFVMTWERSESAAHLIWMRTVVSQLLVGHGAALMRLAEALEAADVMDAEAFVLIVHASRCVCHQWPTATTQEIPMSTLSRKPKAGRSVYVARSTAVAEFAGQDVVVREGVTRIAADDPLLRAHPTLFELDKTGGRLVEPRYSSTFVAPSAPKVAQPVPPEDLVVAIRSFIVARGHAGMVVVQEGDKFDKRHSTVRAHPAEFKPAPRDSAA
jgi:hypothetical protein